MEAVNKCQLMRIKLSGISLKYCMCNLYIVVLTGKPVLVLTEDQKCMKSHLFFEIRKMPTT